MVLRLPRNRTTLLVFFFALVAFGLVLYALSMPYTSPPPVPSGCTPNPLPGDACRSYVKLESSYNSTMWWRQTPFDLGEGLGLAALLIAARPRLKLPDWPSMQGSLPVVLGCIFTLIFVLFAFGAHVDYWVEVDLQVRWLMPSVAWLRGFTDGAVYLGTFAFFALLVASMFFALHFGLRTTVLRFSAPTTLGLMLSLALFDVKEMPIHVTNFTALLSYGGFDFVSNWSVLLVSACVTFLNPPRRDLLLQYQTPLPSVDGWWKGEDTSAMIQECPKCHKPSWLPYQKKVTKEGDQFFSHIVYPHLDESRRKARKCVVKVPTAAKVIPHP